MNDKSYIILTLAASLVASAAVVAAWLLTYTNEEISKLRIEMNTKNANLRTEINNDILHVRNDISRMRIEMREDLDKAKADGLGKNKAPESPEAK